MHPISLLLHYYPELIQNKEATRKQRRVTKSINSSFFLEGRPPHEVILDNQGGRNDKEGGRWQMWGQFYHSGSTEALQR